MSKNLQSGLSLIELLIAITIMGLAISLLSSSIKQKTDQSIRLEKHMTLHQGMMSSFAIIETDIAQGKLSGDWYYGQAHFIWQAELSESSVTQGYYDPVDLVFKGRGQQLQLYKVSVEAQLDNLFKTYSLTIKK